MIAGGAEKSNQCRTSNFFIKVRLLQKDLRYEMWAPNFRFAWAISHLVSPLIQVSILLQPYGTVVANFVPGKLFRRNPWQPLTEPWLRNTGLRSQTRRCRSTISLSTQRPDVLRMQSQSKACTCFNDITHFNEIPSHAAVRKNCNPTPVLVNVNQHVWKTLPKHTLNSL